MCGVTGFIENSNNKCSIESINLMTQSLIRRGPDYQSFIIKNNVALGHARLSIIDLTKNANQPMSSISGRYLISFNGEIYNYKNLNKKINSFHKFESKSDTKTLLEYFDKFGINQTLNDISGMFSIALYDVKLNKLFLIRDRVGEKPLYFGITKKKSYESFVFGSQLSTISKHDNWSGNIDLDSLKSFLNFGFIPSDNSIFQNIKKVKPGHIVIVDTTTFSYKEESYWTYKTSNLSSINNNLEKNKNNFNKILIKTLQEQSISDVPIGAHLSGGIDSSLICSVMAKEKIKFETFTVSFNEIEYDESTHAKNIAKFLGIKNNVIKLDEDSIIDTIYLLSSIYDEPFADSSQIPSSILSKHASNYVKVMITGDGADELFGGYNRHLYLNKFIDMKNYKKYPLKCFIFFLQILSNFKFSKYAINTLLGKYFSNPIEKIYKINNILNSNNISDSYLKIIGIDANLSNLNNKIYNLVNKLEKQESEIFNKIMNIDFGFYLPDDILVKSDKSSMFYGLENRSPYLDKKIIHFAENLSLNLKINNNNSKYILKSLLSDYIPKKLFTRPKQGFAIPLFNLLNGKLKNWSMDHLNLNTMNEIESYKNDVKNNINKFNNKNDINFEKKLWHLLMFQTWHANFFNNE